MPDNEKKVPYPSKCWPDDRDWLDGKTELQIPPSSALRAYWDADLTDAFGIPPGSIISVQDPFNVRFRVELVGDLWHCICGSWCFDFMFTAIGEGPDFNLSSKLPAGALDKKDWEGCKEMCIDLPYTVPAGTVPADACGTLYDVGAKFALRCCEGDRAIVVGYENHSRIEFY